MSDSDEKIVITDEFKQWFADEWLHYEDKSFTSRITSMAWALKAWRYLTKPSTAPTAEDISNALYSHLMGGAFDIGEAYLKLKVVGSCPSEADFLAALLAFAAAKEST